MFQFCAVYITGSSRLAVEVKKEDTTQGSQLIGPCDTLSLDQMSLSSLSYWLRPRREVSEHLAVGQQHWDVVNGIIPAYDRFVHQGDCLNRMLKNDFEVNDPESGWWRL
jgi:hypothetical protein